MQLLAKNPADRFPNTQVLARHLQAMVMALSRPAADDFALAADQPAADRAVMDDGAAISSEATQAESDLSGSRPGRATAEDSGPVTPTSQDAATMAAEDVLGRRQSSLAAAAAAPRETAAAQTTIVRPTRFTTLEEEEALRKDQHQRSWLVVALQLAALAAVLAVIGGAAWYLSRPASADRLYSSIMAQIDSEDGGSIARVENELEEFLSRYPDDPRAEELQQYKERFEVDKLERHLHWQTRRRAGMDASLLPAERLYLRATGIADLEPEKALVMLESLVNLYGADVGSDAARSSPDSSATRMREIVELARRRIATVQRDLSRQREQQLAELNERLDAAQQVSKTDAAKAAAMYRAIIDLHEKDAWAETVVAKARSRLAEINR
jgi:hypothetical protein